MIKPNSYRWVWDHELQAYDVIVVAFVSDGYVTAANGDMIDIADTFPLDAIFVYDVRFVGSDKTFTLYAQDISEAIKLARAKLNGQAGQMGMFPAELESAEEMRLY